MEINAVTQRFGKIVKIITSKVKIDNPLNGESVETTAIWDTGATACAITQSLADRLQLKILAKANVIGVGGEHEANVHFISIKLNNEKIVLNTPVTACNELSYDESIGLLLGMDMITKGDFSISNYSGETVMTFRVPSIECIDYLEELREYNKILKLHKVMSKQGNDDCPCGSGKNFDNCHGKSKYHV